MGQVTTCGYLSHRDQVIEFKFCCVRWGLGKGFAPEGGGHGTTAQGMAPSCWSPESTETPLSDIGFGSCVEPGVGLNAHCGSLSTWGIL